MDIDRRIMELNYFAVIALTKAVAPSMTARNQGHIVSVSSAVGQFGTPWRSAYAASKHALHGFMDSLRAEIADDGVAVTLLCPGFVRTNISRLALTSDGAVHGTQDDGQARGMDAFDCAERMVHAIKRRRSEVYIGGPEIAVIYVK
jgi:short-subunit dehydrogenase